MRDRTWRRRLQASCPGLTRASILFRKVGSPGHLDVKTVLRTFCPAMTNDLTPVYAASAALAFSAIAWNAAGSWMARSDSTLRSTVMPDFDRPLINTL